MLFVLRGNELVQTEINGKVGPFAQDRVVIFCRNTIAAQEKQG